MLLQKLVRYADRIPEIAPPMYDTVLVRYVVDIDSKSMNASIIPLTGEVGKRTERGRLIAVPTLVRSVAIKPKLLADNAEYALGWARENGDGTKVAQRHQAFVDLTRLCADATDDPDVRIVEQYLTGGGIDRLARPDDFDPTQTLTFRVDGRQLVDFPLVREFWVRQMSSDGDGDAEKSECLVCGRLATPVDRLQYKIKGAPGGQTSGTSYISANAGAFESYGLKASRVSPICDQCADQFSKALNGLIASEQHRLYAGGQLFVFWSEGKEEFSPIGLLNVHDESEVRAFLQSVWTGRAREVGDPSVFNAITLSGSGGRLVVRDWIDTTVNDAAESLARYFALQRVVQPDGSEPRPYSLNALVRATVRENSREDPAPLIPRVLVRAALTGAPIPFWIVGQVIRRIRAGQRVTGPQAALIKMALLGMPALSHPEESFMELNQNERHPAYLCGRLLAVLDATQRAALGTRNATIIDRFFGTASSAPASVFGRLLRGSQPHLSTLRKNRPGAYVALEGRIEEIMSGLPEFPRTLSVQDQASFALGYYHQRAWDRGQAREAAERRRRGETPGAEAELADAIESEEDLEG